MIVDLDYLESIGLVRKLTMDDPIFAAAVNECAKALAETIDEEILIQYFADVSTKK